MRIVDQYDDNFGKLRMQSAQGKLPDVVQFSVDMRKVASKREGDYALVVTAADGGKELKFPIVDAGNAVASAFYFEKCASTLPESVSAAVSAKLSEALESFGLGAVGEVVKEAAAGSTRTKLASAVGGALLLHQMFGESEDESSTILAINEMAPHEREKLAHAMLQRGDKSPTPTFDPAAYVGDSIGSGIELAFATRLFAAGCSTEAADELNGFREKVASLRYRPRDMIALLEDFDSKHNLPRYYGSTLLDPIAAVYNTIEKTAAARCTTVQGREVRDEDLRKLAVNKVKLAEKFGEDFADTFSRDPFAVFISLPDPHKNIIAEML